jgi:hypothetical protein
VAAKIPVHPANGGITRAHKAKVLKVQAALCSTVTLPMPMTVPTNLTSALSSKSGPPVTWPARIASSATTFLRRAECPLRVMTGSQGLP